MEYKDFAIDFAERAGEIIEKNFITGMKKEWKADNSPVTETDLAINLMLIEEVRRNFPDHGVLAEEESYNLEAQTLWVCDPVDGTIPFSHGIPISTFSLALVKDGEPIIGVLNDPFMKRLFFAEKGKGAFLNNTSIKVSSRSDLFNSVASFEMFPRAQYKIWGLDEELEKSGVKMTKLASFALPSALVGCGEYLFTIFPHNTVWDAAAVKIIVEEAGGKVTDLFGENQRYDSKIRGVIISNGFVHNQVTEAVCNVLKKNGTKID
ncbi:MAG: inositol monophosphatase [Patescibacteria group bacterium]